MYSSWFCYLASKLKIAEEEKPPLQKKCLQILIGILQLLFIERITCKLFFNLRSVLVNDRLRLLIIKKHSFHHGSPYIAGRSEGTSKRIQMCIAHMFNIVTVIQTFTLEGNVCIIAFCYLFVGRHTADSRLLCHFIVCISGDVYKRQAHDHCYGGAGGGL